MNEPISDHELLEVIQGRASDLARQRVMQALEVDAALAERYELWKAAHPVFQAEAGRNAARSARALQQALLRARSAPPASAARVGRIGLLSRYAAAALLMATVTGAAVLFGIRYDWQSARGLDPAHHATPAALIPNHGPAGPAANAMASGRTFDSVRQALQLAQSGQLVVIKGGTQSGPIRISQPVRIRAAGGTVRVGSLAISDN